MITCNWSFSAMIELWIDDQYEDDVNASPYEAVLEDEHGCFRVTIPDVDELHWLTESWETIGTHFGFQPESIIYVH
jgi:hypothetical protein